MEYEKTASFLRAGLSLKDVAEDEGVSWFEKMTWRTGDQSH